MIPPSLVPVVRRVAITVVLGCAFIGALKGAIDSKENA